MKRTKPLKVKLLDKIVVVNDCWIWTGAKYFGGYGVIHAFGKRMGTHRASYLLFNGPIADGLFVCHHCDNPPCINPKHLFLGTRQDNMDDSVHKGRRPRLVGSQNHSSKLTESIVATCRQRFNKGESLANLAKEFGVHKQTIAYAVKGETWKNVSA